LKPTTLDSFAETRTSEPDTAFDASYEWRAVLLLFLGFGLVGLDRWMIAPLFPTMMHDLRLTYQDLGDAVGALALCWGAFSTLMGNLSDRVGRRRILIPALLVFSAMAGVTGMVVGATMLVATRGVMGATEGAFLSTSVALTGEASHPKRRGLNQGIQLSGFSLFGLALGPIIATQLLGVVPSWRWVFFIVSIPGFVLALSLYRVIREPPHLRLSGEPTPRAPSLPWTCILRSRNVVLSMIGMLCGMSCIFVLGAFIPNYLVDYLHIDRLQMGFVTSGLGFGGFIGGIVMPGLSDHIGRKAAAILCFAGAAAMLYGFVRTGVEPLVLFAFLSGVSFFGSGVLSLLTGPVATEAVPQQLASSAIGIASGAGEIFGGGIGPVAGGYIAQHFGIQNVVLLSLGGLVLGIVVSALLVETAPRRVAVSSIARDC
jgi:MFS family permease